MSALEGIADESYEYALAAVSFRVVYRKPLRSSQLVARLDYFQDQQKGPISRAEFLARAWKVANDKARELCRPNKKPPTT